MSAPPEPEPGPAPGGGAPAVCANCGAALAGPYCARCGQARGSGRLRTREILGDVVSNLFGLESRLWRTLRGLTLRPGRVAAEYVAGRRARYVSPFRYCLTVFAVYFLFNTAIGYDPMRSVGIQVSFGDEQAETGAADGAVEPDEEETPEERQARVVEEVRGFLSRNLVYVFLLALPALGLVLRFLFRSSGHNYAETMVFAYFLGGHAYLLASVFSPLMLVWSEVGQLLRGLFVMAYLAYGATVFFRGPPVAAVAKTVVAYLVFLVAVIAIAVAAAIPFVLLELPPMTRFALLVTVRVRPDAADEFRTKIRAAAAAAEREEPDCLRFEVAQDEEDPATFVLIEVYTDAAALEHHHTTPHFLGFQRDAGHLVLEKSRRRLTLYGG